MILQGIALLFGVLTWLMALGIQVSGSAKLAFFFEGAVGVMVATAGLFFTVVTLRCSELQAARQQKAARRLAPVPCGPFRRGPLGGWRSAARAGLSGPRLSGPRHGRSAAGIGLGRRRPNIRR